MNELHTSILEKLSVLQRLIRRHDRAGMEQAGPFADPSRGQGRILAMLQIQPEIATRDLAYLLGIRQQSLNELLGKLEKGGYIERRPSKNDKRVMVVCLTEKGRQVNTGTGDETHYLDCLSDEELRQFRDYLDRIIASLDSKEDKADDQEWMKRARGRMGDDQFEQLMNMRNRAFGNGSPFGGMKDIPGKERFENGYDGPVPEREDFEPGCGGFGHGQKGFGGWPDGFGPDGEGFGPGVDGFGFFNPDERKQ